MGLLDKIKKIMITLFVSSLLCVLTLTGCSTRNNLEVTKIIYIHTSGDIDKSDVYIFTSDLSLHHQVLTASFDISNLSRFPLAKEDVLDEEYLTIIENDWESIINALKRNDFMTLPEKITPSNQGYDYPTYYIYVETDEESHLSGGYGAGQGKEEYNRRFEDVRFYIESVINTK